MKKKLAYLSLICVFISTLISAQNENSLSGIDSFQNYTENSIAIFSKLDFYTSDTELFTKQDKQNIRNEFMFELSSQISDLVSQYGIRIVSRNNKIYSDTQKWINESKNEDYIEGCSIQAAKIGATHFLFYKVNISLIENKTFLVEVLSNLVSLEDRISDKKTKKYFFPISEYNNASHYNMIVDDTILNLRQTLMKHFPVYFTLIENSGKIATMIPTVPFKLSKGEEVSIYSVESFDADNSGKISKLNKYTLLGQGQYIQSNAGLDEFKLKPKLMVSPTDPLAIIPGTLNHIDFPSYKHYIFSIQPLKPNEYTSKDELFCIDQVNNSIVNALHRIPFCNIIENHESIRLNTEMELQKNEEFLDGRTINKYNFKEVTHEIHLADFECDGYIVDFNLIFSSIQTNESFKKRIRCHYSKLEENICHQISEYLYIPVILKDHTSNEITLASEYPLNADGNSKILVFKKDISTNKIVPILYCSIKDWKGQECLYHIDKIIEPSLMNSIDDNRSGLWMAFVFPEP